MSEGSRPAIFVYSKGGYSMRAAEALAGISGAECIPLDVDRYRFPLFWIPRAIYDVARENTPPLAGVPPDGEGRPWVVLAGPIWAGQLAPPLRTVISALSGRDVPVALLTTSGGHSPPEKAYGSARALLGRDFTATVNVSNSREGRNGMTDRLTEFARILRAHEQRRIA